MPSAFLKLYFCLRTIYNIYFLAYQYQSIS